MSDVEREEMTKAVLIERSWAERRRFQGLVGQLSEQQMLEPEVQGKWSVKDIVAHVVDWEERMIRWLDEGMRGETPVMPAPGLEWREIDQLNEQIYQAHKDEPLDRVLATFEGLEPAVLESIRAVPEEDLLSSEQYPWTGGEPLWILVAANTFWHYPAHAKVIREKLGVG